MLPPPHTHTGPPSVDKHLKVVRENTWDARSNWYNLGVKLKFNAETLKVGHCARV